MSKTSVFSRTSVFPVVYIVMSMVFWALSFVWIKVAYQSFDPITTVLFRLIISAGLLFGFLTITNRLKAIKKEDYKPILMLSFFEPFLYFMGESFGVKLVSSTLAAVIVSTIPLFATLFAFLFLKEKVTPLAVLGIVISFFGVGIMIFENGFELNASLLGILLMLVAVLSTIGYSLTLKNLSQKYSAINIVAYQNFIGIFMFAPFFFIWEYKGLINTNITGDSWIAVFQLAVFASSLAFIFFTKAIKFLGVAKTNMFTNLIPVFTALFAWWIIGDAIDTQKAMGIATVVMGLFVSQIKKRNNGARFRKIPTVSQQQSQGE
ncbi:Permease of the drug/metabolite transporter (DMT) superfamily [Saccharicrinis carchari]|uniref:Permease of the drug/metabolite transporter (DMT) superfamily n=1 Tax=Saccharicrinis carchari TaxID=1168039 RepID=A0A521DB46_SACCC|nr:DMT family transporter [Saccharicrinis carchari]SMO68954.1 Permease of the drug/metabolite transporter (DMT) superfamily [Saccharicrinis carchari]